MVQQEHLDILLKQSVSEWNKWRKVRSEILPDLRDANLSEGNLDHINFKRVDVTGANLRGTSLCSACLSFANLMGADLTGANLSHANLDGAIFRKTLLSNAKCTNADVRDTLFVDTDLSTLNGLETVHHLGPSIIDITTIYRSHGKISEKFLRGAGVPEVFLDFVRKQGKKPFDYFTCFISYANEDEHFVEVLRQDLQKAGVRCWFTPINSRPGERFPEKIAEAIRFHDKLLLVFSKHSLKSTWVEHEVELARQKEQQNGGKTLVLFPIHLDSTVIDQPGWAKFIKEKRHIADFLHWKQPPVYQKRLNSLLSALNKTVGNM